MKNTQEVMEKVAPVQNLNTFVVKPTGNTSLVLEPSRALISTKGEEVILGNEAVPQLFRRMGILRLVSNLTPHTIEAVASRPLTTA